MKWICEILSNINSGGANKILKPFQKKIQITHVYTQANILQAIQAAYYRADMNLQRDVKQINIHGVNFI